MRRPSWAELVSQQERPTRQIEPRASSDTCGAPPGITVNPTGRLHTDASLTTKLAARSSYSRAFRMISGSWPSPARPRGGPWPFNSTIVDFERKRRAVSPEAIAAIRNALEAAGIEFIDEKWRRCWGTLAQAVSR